MAKIESDFRPYDLQDEMLAQVRLKGGFSCAHAHLDRAWTLTPENHKDAGEVLEDKWIIVDPMKRESTVGQITSRMKYAVERLVRQGVTSIGSFIDVDSVIGDKAMQAATLVRDDFKNDVDIKYANQTLKGVLKPEALHWFEIGAKWADIVGGLPRADRDKNETHKGEIEHLQVVLGTAKDLGKMAHVHIDQKNIPTEWETKLLIDQMDALKIEPNRVAGVHGISIGAHPERTREYLYQEMLRVGLMMIACPTAWIDSKRDEALMVRHNSVTPFDELAPRGVVTAIGVDNVSDVYLPLNKGNMLNEMVLLAEATHYFDNMDQIHQVVRSATDHGRMVLGLPPYTKPLRTVPACNGRFLTTV